MTLQTLTILLCMLPFHDTAKNYHPSLYIITSTWHCKNLSSFAVCYLFMILQKIIILLCMSSHLPDTAVMKKDFSFLFQFPSSKFGRILQRATFGQFQTYKALLTISNSKTAMTNNMTLGATGSSVAIPHIWSTSSQYINWFESGSGHMGRKPKMYIDKVRPLGVCRSTNASWYMLTAKNVKMQLKRSFHLFWWITSGDVS